MQEVACGHLSGQDGANSADDDTMQPGAGAWLGRDRGEGDDGARPGSSLPGQSEWDISRPARMSQSVPPTSPASRRAGRHAVWDASPQARTVRA